MVLPGLFTQLVGVGMMIQHQDESMKQHFFDKKPG
jgi:hypothetical protein